MSDDEPLPNLIGMANYGSKAPAKRFAPKRVTKPSDENTEQTTEQTTSLEHIAPRELSKINAPTSKVDRNIQIQIMAFAEGSEGQAPDSSKQTKALAPSNIEIANNRARPILLANKVQPPPTNKPSIVPSKQSEAAQAPVPPLPRTSGATVTIANVPAKKRPIRNEASESSKTSSKQNNLAAVRSLSLSSSGASTTQRGSKEAIATPSANDEVATEQIAVLSRPSSAPSETSTSRGIGKPVSKRLLETSADVAPPRKRGRTAEVGAGVALEASIQPLSNTGAGRVVPSPVARRGRRSLFDHTLATTVIPLPLPVSTSTENIDKSKRRGMPKSAQDTFMVSNASSNSPTYAADGTDPNYGSKRTKIVIEDKKGRALAFVRSFAVKYLDVAAGRDLMRGIKPMFGISGAKSAERSAKRADTARRSLQSTLVLPQSFGESTTFTTHTVFLRLSPDGIGLMLKNIDGRAVVRGIAPEFPRELNVRTNDVILSVNSMDARSTTFERLIQALRKVETLPSQDKEKIAVGMTVVEDIVCVRFARPVLQREVVSSVSLKEADETPSCSTASPWARASTSINANDTIPCVPPPIPNATAHATYRVDESMIGSAPLAAAISSGGPTQGHKVRLTRPGSKR